MSGPYPFSRQMQAVEQLLDAAPNWDSLERALSPLVPPDRYDPGEDMKKMLAAFARTAQGRQLVDWIADLTVRAPYPHVGADFQSAAIAAAKHEARTAVGYAVMRAIADGNDLLNARSPK